MTAVCFQRTKIRRHLPNLKLSPTLTLIGRLYWDCLLLLAFLTRACSNKNVELSDEGDELFKDTSATGFIGKEGVYKPVQWDTGDNLRTNSDLLGCSITRTRPTKAKDVEDPEKLPVISDQISLGTHS